MISPQFYGPMATAYIYKGRLCVMGIEETDLGPVPFAVSADVGEIDDGPVDFGAELPAPVEAAIENLGEPIDAAVADGHLRLAVEHLCLRARNGDQNAMAMLGGIRESARNGSARAQKCFDLAEQYLKVNLPKAKPVFGIDVPDFPKMDTSILRDATGPIENTHAALVFCGRVGANRMASMVVRSGIPIVEICTYAKRIANPRALWEGMRHSRFLTALEQARQRLDPETFVAFELGVALGRARAILEARNGNIKPSLTPAIGWELGY